MNRALIVVSVCVLVEAFFSGSEMAVVAADRNRLKNLAEAGGKGARILLNFLAMPQRLLATTLMGTQLAVVTSTIVTTVAVLDNPNWAHHGELVTIGLLSPVLLVFGEVVPKTFFQQHADVVAPKVAFPLWVASMIMWPFVRGMTFVTQAITRILGLEEPRALITREELELLLQTPTATSDIAEGQRKMLRRIFDFSETTVYDVMVPLSEVFVLPDDATLDEAAREVQEKGHTRIPIYRERVDQIVGVLRSFDLLRQGSATGSVGQLAITPVFVPETQAVSDLLGRLQRERRTMAIVVDEYGGAIGIVTVEDILEEVVGEIEDEYDRPEQAVMRREGPGVWRVAGRASVAHVNAESEAHLPEGEDYETVAGLVLAELRRIPRVGEGIRVGNATLTVVRATERAIEEVELRIKKK